MQFPNRIRQFRKLAGMSQARLAELIGTSDQQLSRLERGDRRLSQFWLERLAPVLSCRPYELLPDSPEAASGATQDQSGFSGVPALPDHHWLRDLPDAGRPQIQDAQRIEGLYARLAQVLNEIEEAENAAVQAARAHWSEEEIAAARRDTAS